LPIYGLEAQEQLVARWTSEYRGLDSQIALRVEWVGAGDVLLPVRLTIEIRVESSVDGIVRVQSVRGFPEVGQAVPVAVGQHGNHDRIAGGAERGIGGVG